MRTGRTLDRIFLWIVLILSFGGLFIFSSAALGVLAEDIQSFLIIIVKQLFLGLILGLLAMFIVLNINYKNWQKYAFYIFVISVVVSLLVFIPGIGIENLGAKRWIDLGFMTFQPAEFLKLGFIIYFASWLSRQKDRLGDFRKTFLPAIAIMAVPTLILIAQPDHGTLLSILATAVAMYLIAGGKWTHFILIILIGLLAFATTIYFKPYAITRIQTFLDPFADPLGAGYQIRQALIAVGSGGIFGRGFGQSVQKFGFLPETVGDSIFAVFAEEFGLLGTSLIILLFLAFTLRGFRIVKRAPDNFSGLMVLGIVILIASQSFINMGAMLGIVPLTGIPLIFISHGGTALFMALIEVGIVLNVSKRAQT
ncbi:MAG: putative lipid II flippase FtsW [Candidatus Vogelbacteria bacterium]|nr:putative lipid II flippase FtsW [Candidatus Vogelbacteria bacterium]